jgi:hypothetical protein
MCQLRSEQPLLYDTFEKKMLVINRRLGAS